MVSNPEPLTQTTGGSGRRHGVVKQVLSGDAVVIRGPPRNGPPLEMQLFFSSVTAPRLARRGNAPGDFTDDEPFAWEVREYLRKKVIGKEVQASVDHTVPNSGREYGSLWLTEDGQATENVIETMVSEGWLEVKKTGIRPDEQYGRLIELEEKARAAGLGRWQPNADPKEHIRDITWSVENVQRFFDSNKKKPIKAVVEFVRDCCTVRATLLPDFYPAMIALTGIRGPSFKQDGSKDEYADEAKFFTESRLLQRDVEIILEGLNNNLLIGTIVHPAGSITEALLKQGFARCVDWSIGMYSGGADKLRAAEREAKEKKIRIWKNYEPAQINFREGEKHYTAKVVEINNADSITVKLASGQLKKIFISGVRPPKLAPGEEAAGPPKTGKEKFRPIYDIPFMFEAREFLRKKLIGQKVDVTLDYVQQPRAGEAERDFPERHCCSVVIGDTNVAEALLSRGLASIVFYRQDDEQRPSNYDVLLAAEQKAQAGKKGLHGKKTATGFRVADVSGDTAKAKAFLPGFQRAGKQEAIVEYVGSGSRFRILIPKSSCVVSLILAGVRCPKGSRMGPAGPNGPILPAEEGGEAALNFSKELAAQRDVTVEISDMDKVGNFIGWMFVEGKNVSLELVEAGHGSVNHYSAERSPYLSALEKAEANAKARKLGIWANFVESEAEVKTEDDHSDRSEHYKRVMVVETLPNLHFFAQNVEDGPKLEALMDNVRQEFSSNPPLQGSYAPKRGDVCAARFSDGQWYRAKVEALQGGKAEILYLDYGNRESTSVGNLALLPASLKSAEPFAKEYGLAFVREHTEDSDAEYAFGVLVKDGVPVLLNVEYGNSVTLLKSDTKADVAKTLITDGQVLLDHRKERRFQKIMEEYKDAQEQAKRSRKNIWRYGDITADDAKEFGMSGR